jgi:hypothetical protein
MGGELNRPLPFCRSQLIWLNLSNDGFEAIRTPWAAGVKLVDGKVGGRSNPGSKPTHAEISKGPTCAHSGHSRGPLELDDYGRSVCHIFKGATNIHLEMIRKGWGWLPDRREWIRDEASFAAEKAARSAGLGAWGLADQQSPSRWRHRCWRGGECDGAVNWPDLP